MAISPAQHGVDRLVPPTRYQGLVAPPLEESYTATPVKGSASKAASGVVRWVVLCVTPLCCWAVWGPPVLMPPPPLVRASTSPTASATTVPSAPAADRTTFRVPLLNEYFPSFWKARPPETMPTGSFCWLTFTVSSNLLPSKIWYWAFVARSAPPTQVAATSRNGGAMGGVALGFGLGRVSITQMAVLEEPAAARR